MDWRGASAPDRTGAVLAGVAFAGSGYIACQLKHLASSRRSCGCRSGLRAARPDACGDRRPVPRDARSTCGGIRPGRSPSRCSAASRSRPTSARSSTARSRCSARSAIDSALGPLSRWLHAARRHRASSTALGAAAGAVVLLPLSKLGSDLGSIRGARLEVVDAARVLAAEHPDVLRAVHQRRHLQQHATSGRRSSGRTTATSASRPCCWRSTAASASGGGRVVVFIDRDDGVAYLFVLGAATPVFRVAYLLIPGMKMFRFPTRFLIVVELGLALLGGGRADAAARAISTRRLNRTSDAVLIASAARPLIVVDRDLRDHGRGSCRSISRGRTRWCRRASGSRRRRAWPSIRADANRSRARSRRGRAIAASADVPGRQRLGRRRSRTSSCATCCSRTSAAGSGACRRPTATRGSRPRWYVDVWGDHNREASLVSR